MPPDEPRIWPVSRGTTETIGEEWFAMQVTSVFDVEDEEVKVVNSILEEGARKAKGVGDRQATVVSSSSTYV
jgi:hypothetical protein